MNTKSKRYYLVFFLRGLTNQVVFEVAEGVSDALTNEIDQLCSSDPETKVYQFDTVDGQSVAINFEFVQSVRFLWEPIFVQHKDEEYDGAIRIWRRDASEPIVVSYDDPVQVYDFYTNVGYGPSVELCPSFLDEDGELFVLNAKELLYLAVPTDAMNEGQSIVLAEAVVEEAKKPTPGKAVKVAKRRLTRKAD
jgi:hypothetical protein